MVRGDKVDFFSFSLASAAEQESPGEDGIAGTSNSGD